VVYTPPYYPGKQGGIPLRIVLPLFPRVIPVCAESSLSLPCVIPVSLVVDGSPSVCYSRFTVGLEGPAPASLPFPVSLLVTSCTLSSRFTVGQELHTVNTRFTVGAHPVSRPPVPLNVEHSGFLPRTKVSQNGKCRNVQECQKRGAGRWVYQQC